ncbi:MFS transporter [Phytoactinopolyspora limicola]|uniref:MFS transporter n=1 Tax=Phytoactinopolyspora limicola TaxID=2715536 RepID=UPI00140E00C0|nr:MFS transporter [Phytoactinopolyspora limicola]
MRNSSSPQSGAAPPRSLSPAGLRRVLATLCLTEIVSWGVLYYAFPVLLTEISTDTGWSRTLITAAFSAGLLVAALVGIPVGRRLDGHGPRVLMTAGSALAVPSVIVIAAAPNLAVFTAGWLVAGVAMAAILYPPAFAALTRWYGPRRVKALTLLTLAAGLASTVFAPLTAFIMDHLDWRGTYLVLAAVLAVITVPGHWWGLRGPWPAADHADPTTSPRPAQPASNSPAARPTSNGTATTGPVHAAVHNPGDPARIARSAPFVALMVALGLSSFTAFAVVINLVPLMIEHGIDTGTAALALGLGGLGQVIGRVGYPALTRLLGVRARTVSILAATALTTGLLSVLTSVTVLIGAAIVAGMARGLLTLIQAMAVTDRWGTAHYGRLTGLLSAPITITVALAPWAGAAIADLLGSYASAFLVLTAVGVVSIGFAAFSAPRDR